MGPGDSGGFSCPIFLYFFGGNDTATESATKPRLPFFPMGSPRNALANAMPVSPMAAGALNLSTYPPGHLGAAPVASLLASINRGFTVTIQTCPKWLAWAIDISPVAYAMEAMTATRHKRLGRSAEGNELDLTPVPGLKQLLRGLDHVGCLRQKRLCYLFWPVPSGSEL